ncbi:hypothetical protein MSG28_007795, partial [Choristoneura fumiferana]
MIQNTRSTQFCSKRVISPETFKAEQQYGITLLISEDAQIKSFLTNLLTQSEVRRWRCRIVEGKNETVSSKELKKIQQEIRDVMLQVAATISYLPFLDCRCSFDVLVHAKTDCDVPEKWAEAEPVAIQNAQNVQFKAFSTGLNKVETV